MTNLMKMKNGFDIWSAGSKRVQALWDNVNSRLSWYVGTTEIARMDATTGFSNLLAGAGSFTGSVAAAVGGGQSGATALTTAENDVTTVTSNFDSVKLPTPVAGESVTVRNSGATILSVFPASGHTINGMAVNLSIDVAVGAYVTFRGISATAWKTTTTVSLPSPSTQKGSLALKASDNSGNTQTIITNASQAAARTYTIPDAGASASFMMTQGAQSVVGIQTYSVPLVYNYATAIAANAGGGQSSGTALTAEYNDVTTVTSNFDSVKLPTAVLGQSITVRNSGASILSVFPATSGTIDGLAVNLSIDIPVGGEVIFRGISTTAWKTGTTVNLHSPSTQKGNLILKAADSAGNTQTIITNASQAAARTYTIPDAGASASFVMTEGAQTINGVRTFGSMFVIPRATLAATGTNLATAAQLVAGYTTVTAADDTVGVKLPATPVAGTMVIVKSTVSNKILKVYPDAAATINAIAANAAISLASGPTPAIFIADSATQWYTIPLLPS